MRPDEGWPSREADALAAAEAARDRALAEVEELRRDRMAHRAWLGMVLGRDVITEGDEDAAHEEFAVCWRRMASIERAEARLRAVLAQDTARKDDTDA